MSETQPDMNRTAPELRTQTSSSEIEQDADTEEKRAARQTEIDRQMLEEQAASQKEALEIAAGLKKGGDKKRVVYKEEPPSNAEELIGAIGAITVGSVVPAVGKIGKWGGYLLSSIFSAIENSGYETLKKFWLFKWMEKPAKTWREQDLEAQKKREEVAKKKEAEAKKAEDEKKRKKKLEKAGLSEEQADALLDAAKPEGETGKEEKPVEPPKEEKAA